MIFFILAGALGCEVSGTQTEYYCQTFGCANEVVSLLQTAHELTSQEHLDQAPWDLVPKINRESAGVRDADNISNLGETFDYHGKAHSEWKGDSGRSRTAAAINATLLQASASSRAATSLSSMASLEDLAFQISFVILVGLILIGKLPDSSGPLAPPSESAASFTAKDSGKAVGTQMLGKAVGTQMPEIQIAVQKGGIAALVMAQAQKEPSRKALVDAQEGVSLDYSDLYASVTRFAQALSSAGLGSGDVMALLLPPSRVTVIATLGAMQAKVAWLPLDPELPSKDLSKKLALARARLAVGLSAIDTDDSGVPFWVLGPSGEPPQKVTGVPVTREQRCEPLCPADITAIYFTSGSTGTPKGVMYGTEFLTYTVMTFSKLCSVDASTVGLVKTPSIWAVASWELFPALIQGGRIVVDARCQKNVRQLATVIKQFDVSVLVSSAPVLKLLVEDCMDAFEATSGTTPLKHIVNVGGALPLSCCSFVHSVLPQTFLHNVYGCTESTCTEWTYRPDDQHWSDGTTETNAAPAGHPQPESQVYILNKDFQPVAFGEIGEVFMGGAFTSRGYLGDATLTEARFIKRDNLTLYRTGDLGKFSAIALTAGGKSFGSEGGGIVLEITGRADRQLNISGVRVAPEEIETVISQVEGVAEVAVVAATSSIVAFFKSRNAKQSEEGNLAEVIRLHCVENLSARMRPALIIQLGELPKLGNGKINLQKLSDQAQKESAESLQSVVDSLGQMKTVNKDALLEQDVLAASRGISILFVITFHWFWPQYFETGHMWDPNSVTAAFTNDYPFWLRLFLRSSLISSWCMTCFAIMSGYTDRKAAEERRLGQTRENVLVLFIWLSYPLLVSLMSIVITFERNEVGLKSLIRSPLWYFAFYLLCRLFSSCVMMPLERCLRSTRFIAPIRILLIGFSCMYATITPPLFPQCGWFCDIVNILLGLWIESKMLIGFLLPGYVLSWYFGADLVRFVTKHWPSNIGPWAPASICLGVMLSLGWLAEKDIVHHWCTFDGDFGKPGKWVMVALDLFLALMIILTFALAAGRQWLRWTPLVRLGQSSLGTYVGHVLFDFFMKQSIFRKHVPDLPSTMLFAGRYTGGFGELFAFFAYPTVFALSFGALYQSTFISMFGAIEKGFQRIYVKK
jgi:acyl-coenzyme A synthetase/AMP-(fatty) acid ligase